MKTFEMGVENTTEILPTIKRRGLMTKQRRNDDNRFQKKHHIQDYQNYLGVFSLPLINEREIVLGRKQTFASTRNNLVPLSKKNLTKSHSGEMKKTVIQKLEDLPVKTLKHKESGCIPSRMYRVNYKPIPSQSIPCDEDCPDLPSFAHSGNPYTQNEGSRDEESFSSQDREFFVPLAPKIQVKKYSYSYQLMQEEI